MNDKVRGGKKMIIQDKDMHKEIRTECFGGQGDVEFKFLIPPEKLKGEAKMFNLLTFAPGSSLGLHEHTDNFELYYILEGTATVDDNGTTVDVGPGDMIYTADGAKHSITAKSPMKMIATVVYENKAE